MLSLGIRPSAIGKMTYVSLWLKAAVVAHVNNVRSYPESGPQ